jgi:hypothetical protein
LRELVWLGTARLILREAARRLDGADLVEVEIEDSLQCFAGGGVAERVGQRLEPLRVFALQGDEFGRALRYAKAPRPPAARPPPTVTFLTKWQKQWHIYLVDTFFEGYGFGTGR